MVSEQCSGWRAACSSAAASGVSARYRASGGGERHNLKVERQ
jgi:hypothetical protein